MMLAQVAAEVVQVNRKIDILLKAQRRSDQDMPEFPKSTGYRELREADMSRGLLISFRTFSRAYLCENPTTEVKGPYRRNQKRRFFDQAIVDGNDIALEFFKSKDIDNAVTMQRENSPSKGVSPLKINDYINMNGRYKISTLIFFNTKRLCLRFDFTVGCHYFQEHQESKIRLECANEGGCSNALEDPPFTTELQHTRNDHPSYSTFLHPA